ncbi:LOW QUALITY PROTEIN: hypothetical protein KIPB_005884, partial [Kipferlia bialata]
LRGDLMTGIPSPPPGSLPPDPQKKVGNSCRSLWLSLSLCASALGGVYDGACGLHSVSTVCPGPYKVQHLNPSVDRYHLVPVGCAAHIDNRLPMVLKGLEVLVSRIPDPHPLLPWLCSLPLAMSKR